MLHLPQFPASVGLGQSCHTGFVILKVNARGKINKQQPTYKKPNKKHRIPLQSCRLAVRHGTGQGPDQPGSQGLLASRGQRSIWDFSLGRSAPGATEGRGREPPALAPCQPVSSHLPLPGQARPAALTLPLSFVSPPASALIPSSAAHHPS